MEQDPADWFSIDYRQARQRFLDAAQAVGARVTRRFHPSATGPGAMALSMDMACLGDPAAPGALVVISGTHGPEGYCGSGVQTGLLQSGHAEAWAASGIRVVLLHAHNPYGFAWDTRFNEDNIDLNRNYLADWTAPLPANDGYDALAAWAAPETRDADTLAEAERQLLGYAAQYGFGALQGALSGGQYKHPAGVYFGGSAPSWSHTSLLDLLSEACAGAARIVSVDMHTGLGPFGHGELISESAPGSAHHARQDCVWPGQMRSTKDGSSVSADLHGTLDTALLRAFPDAWTAVAALEFGTVEPMRVFRATQASSWLHVHADREGPEAPAIRAEMRTAFYPDSKDWRRQVWARSMEVLEAGARAAGVINGGG